MKKIVSAAVILLSVILTSCWYNHKWEDMHPNGQTAGPATPCDSSGTISYSLTVQPILNTQCATSSACHGAGASGAPADYTVFNNVVTDAHNGHQNDIMSRINAPVSGPPAFMPSGGSPLSACNKAQIRLWISQGCQNN